MDKVFAINKKPLGLQVAEYIKEAILHGRLRPGDKITELAMAEELSVSQAPVREALQILISEGFVTPRGKRGKYVTQLTPKEIRDSYFAGGVLEGSVVAAAIDSFTDEDIAVIDGIVEQMRGIAEKAEKPGATGKSAGKKASGAAKARAVAEASANDASAAGRAAAEETAASRESAGGVSTTADARAAEALAALDVGFHHVLFAKGDNDIVRDLWFRSCQVIGKYFFYKKWTDMDLFAVYERHKKIADALRTRNPQHIEKIIREHYSSAGEILAGYAERAEKNQTTL